MQSPPPGVRFLPQTATTPTNPPTTAEGSEKPTPRAISERLFKIKQMAKASGVATKGATTSPAKASSSAGTPRKRATNGDGVKKTATPSKNGAKAATAGGKRKRAAGRMSDEYVPPHPLHGT